jgi:hypothetical protein
MLDTPLTDTQLEYVRQSLERNPAVNSKLDKLLKLVNFGTGSPENVVTASPPALYLDEAGGASLTLYVKESGTNTNTGWIAK